MVINYFMQEQHVQSKSVMT